MSVVERLAPTHVFDANLRGPISGAGRGTTVVSISSAASANETRRGREVGARASSEASRSVSVRGMAPASRDDDGRQIDKRRSGAPLA